MRVIHVGMVLIRNLSITVMFFPLLDMEYGLLCGPGA